MTILDEQTENTEWMEYLYRRQYLRGEIDMQQYEKLLDELNGDY